METVGSAFRKHPELEPSGKLSLLGRAYCSAELMNAYLRRRNPQAPELADLYLRAGERYGVRGDVAFCQMVHETRGWTEEIAGPSWSPRLLAQWMEEESIEAHMQILYSFAMGLPIPQQSDVASRQIERIERAGWRGTVACWEDLNGKWSALGNHRYGQDIVAIWRNMLEWRGSGAAMNNHPQEQDNPRRLAQREKMTGNLDWSSLSNESMKWLHSRRLLPVPAPHPDRKVTWAELADLLHRWEKRSPADTIENEASLY